MREISAQIQGRVGSDDVAPFVLHAVDKRRNSRQFSRQVQAVLQHRLPVIFFAQVLVVTFSKNGFTLHSQDCHREKRHRMGILGHGF